MSGRPRRLTAGLLWAALAGLIALLAYTFGEQPVWGDGIEYRRLAEVIARQGLGEFASDLRTYGYPCFLALLISLVGTDLTTLRPAVFAAQLLVLVVGAALGAVRIGRPLGSGSLGMTVFAATVVNPLFLLYTVQVLTDVLSAVLIYLAVAYSLPQQPPESRRRVGALGIVAFLPAGLSVMVRPANLVLVPALNQGHGGIHMVVGTRSASFTVARTGDLSLSGRMLQSVQRHVGSAHDPGFIPSGPSRS
jgi:hypothetical protein